MPSRKNRQFQPLNGKNGEKIFHSEKFLHSNKNGTLSEKVPKMLKKEVEKNCFALLLILQQLPCQDIVFVMSLTIGKESS